MEEGYWQSIWDEIIQKLEMDEKDDFTIQVVYSNIILLLFQHVT